MALWILAAPGAMAGAQAPSSRPAAGRSGPPAPSEVPSWAFPSPAPTPPAAIDSVLQLHVPRSLATYTAAQVRDRLAVPDWHPEGHPRMPSVVAIGRKPGLYACAFCHLADGAGRPENAMLAGLPAAYIVQQVADIKSSARRSAWLGPYLPSDAMRTVADSATAAEVAAAARYFARLRPRQRARVVEVDSIPRVSAALGLYFPAPEGGVEPLGRRLIEVPADPECHELRDAHVAYIA